MHDFGTHTGIARRDNDLAHLICMARDCFDHVLEGELPTPAVSATPIRPARGTRESSPYSMQGVNATRVGPNADKCMERRALPHEEQARPRPDLR